MGSQRVGHYRATKQAHTSLTINSVPVFIAFASVINAFFPGDKDPGKNNFYPLALAGLVSYRLHGCAVFSCTWLFETPETAVHQGPLSMVFPRQECWSRLPFPPPENLPHPGIEAESPVTPALAGRFSTTEPLRKPSPRLPRFSSLAGT